jgi:hypothetical protein
VDAKKQATEFSAYKRGKKREWVAEKSDLAALLGNIKTKAEHIPAATVRASSRVEVKRS